jgi:hypothetical protein
VVADDARADSADSGLCDRADTFLFVSPIDEKRDDGLSEQWNRLAGNVVERARGSSTSS